MLPDNIKALQGRQRNIMGHEQAAQSAVLLPLVEVGGELSVLFEKRAPHLFRQPGEICFPGGGIEDDDDDAKATAVRETCEELGLEAGDLEVIAPLDLLITPFSAIVYPYVGYIRDNLRIRINPNEVEKVFYVPLEYLLHNKPLQKNLAFKMDAPEDFPYELIPHGRQYPFRQANYPQHFYIWQEYVIWGLTALVLTHFLRLIQQPPAEPLLY
ncbi:MAG: CoA pyrophosphatase [Syntrophomonadaceae bacterium]